MKHQAATSRKSTMIAQFAIEDLVPIEIALQEYSEPFHVDSVAYTVDRTNLKAVAKFTCEHYGCCLVTRTLRKDQTVLSLFEIRKMAELANMELEAIVSESAWGAVFDLEASVPRPVAPLGYSVEFKPVMT